jgi:hypothetical protein
MVVTDTGAIGLLGREITYGIVLVIEVALSLIGLRLTINLFRQNKHTLGRK